MTNLHTAERIVDALQQKELVVEIGPGKGVLTDLLVDCCDELILIEKDDTLAGQLTERYIETPRVRVVNADFLKVNLAEHLGVRPFSLIGNFPYNISSQIVFRMLDYKEQVVEMVGMFQYEMAQRIIAGPGTKSYSVIGVLSQTAFLPAMVMRVGPGQFNPPPKVESAVIRLVQKPDLHPPCSFKLLRAVVKSAFAQRRKMMRNSLKSLISEELMADNPVFLLRPEQIPLETFYTLANLAEASQQSKSNNP